VTDAADDGFLSRWSQRKARVRSGQADAAVASAPPAGQGAPMPSLRVDPRPALLEDPVVLPTMDDVALLTRGSDFSRFVGPGVDPGVSNAAMKKLFSDPRYNVMDVLDTYIDDYGRPDPISLSTLRQMHQSKGLGLFDTGEEANAAMPPARSTGPPVPALAEPADLRDPAQPACTPEPDPDDDADLRLQQDDAARRPGAGPSAGA
jgi:hypothetical protein